MPNTRGSYNEPLVDRLRGELGGPDLVQALQLLNTGLLEPADEIYIAVTGAGTDEERLFAVLTALNAQADPRLAIQKAVDSYRTKGYGDMVADITGDLSGARARARAQAARHQAADKLPRDAHDPR